MSEQLKLWFFRDLTDDQRLKLFGLFGLPVDEIGNVHGRQTIALRHIVQKLIKMVGDEAQPAPADNVVAERQWPKNPFKKDILKKQFAACIYCYFSRDKDFFRADGSRHTDNGVANQFWWGFDGARKPEQWDGGRDTPAYASYRAGELIAAYERSLTPSPSQGKVGTP